MNILLSVLNRLFTMPQFLAATTVLDDLFTLLGNAVASLFVMITAILTGAVAIFYVASVGEVAGYFSFMGTLLLVGLGYRMISGFIGWVKSFITLRG